MQYISLNVAITRLIGAIYDAFDSMVSTDTNTLLAQLLCADKCFQK